MNLYFSIISNSLAWALVYSLFQGLFIYTMLFMLLRAFPGLGARLKYGVSYGALAGIFVWFVYTWTSRSIAMSGQASVQGVDAGHPVSAALRYLTTGTQVGGRGLQQMLNSMEQLFPWFL